MPDIIPCVIKSLPNRKAIAAATTAIRINPNNQPSSHRVAALFAGPAPAPAKLALIIGKRWAPSGVRLTVSFMDNPPSDLRTRILAHMNAWGARSNIEFAETSSNGQVRIAREANGYWSYLGTDVLLIPPDEPTLNLQGFSMDTPDSEFYRVVRHEAGHTLGFPHEHMRRTLVNRIDPKKAIAYFGATQGWTVAEVRQQVLTPLEAVKLKLSYRTDQDSIMCYRIPGSLTKSGRPIPGGKDITEMDHAFAAAVYPK